jgi:polysaccharide export outer membrane protein
MQRNSGPRWLGQWGICLLFLACAGCETTNDLATQDGVLPHEMSQLSLPPYIIEPPDVLVIDALRLIPKPPYRVAPLDVLGIQVNGAFEKQPIAGLYSVESDGKVNLGFDYGSVKLEGMTLEEAKAEIYRYLTTKTGPGALLKTITVTVALAESRGLQQIRGPHLVHPDGTVTLGVYGSVFIDGLTIAEAKKAIEDFLEQFLVKPEVSVDIAGFNSKVYYVITDGAGSGAQVARFPVTGKTNVLDALSQVNGLSPISSKCVYLVRPAPSGSCAEVVRKVKWHAIARCGETDTNYQVFPGDRIYIVGDPLVTTDTFLARLIAPAERLFGISLLGESTVNAFRTPINKSGTLTLQP